MDKVSPKHFVFLLLATGIVSLKTYPFAFIGNTGRDSWVAVIISSIMIFFFILFAAKAVKKSENGNFVRIYQTALGKPIGNIFIVIFCVTVFLCLVESACVQADAMHQNMMEETPNWYFIFFFIVPSIYVVRKNLAAVIIICIVGISFIMIAGMNLGVLTTQQKHLTLLFPIFENGITGDFITSILKSLGMYGFMSITLPYLHAVDPERASLSKYVIIGLLINIQMQIVSITGIFMTFNPEIAQSYHYPKLIQTHLVSYFQMLEFGELYVMLQTLGGWLLKYLVAFHALMQIFKFYRWKERSINISIYIISALAFIFSYYASATSIRLFSLLEYFPWITLVNFIIIPLIVLIIYKVRTKTREHTNATPAKTAQNSNPKAQNS